MKSILVAIDFEEGAQTLIEKATDIAKKYDAKLWLVHVAAPEPDFIGYDVGPVYIRDYRARELKTERKILDEYVNEAKKSGVDAQGLLIDGITVNLLVEEAVKLNADLMIVGHQKHGFLYKLWFGSTAEELIHTHSIPTLVIPL